MTIGTGTFLKQECPRPQFKFYQLVIFIVLVIAIIFVFLFFLFHNLRHLLIKTNINIAKFTKNIHKFVSNLKICDIMQEMLEKIFGGYCV